MLFRSVNKKLRIRKEKMNKAALELKTLEAWSRYDMPLEIRETRQVRFELGVVPATVNVDDLREAVAKVSDSASIETVNRDKDMIYIFTADLTTATASWRRAPSSPTASPRAWSSCTTPRSAP